MKLWIDDIRPAPDGYDWITSVNEAINAILIAEKSTAALIKLKKMAGMESDCDRVAKKYGIELIDIDHDAGDEANDGGDYIKLLDWLEETGRSYPIRIHSQNPVGVENIRRIIGRNGWKMDGKKSGN